MFINNTAQIKKALLPNDLSMKPMVFAAMPNKSRQLYEQLLRSLVSYAESLDVKLEPKSILIDFEQGAVQAFQTVFPGIQ
ncbi:unnamed protein product, partial [Didymodactylos carnosus]